MSAPSDLPCDLTVIVVSYNSRALTLKCLETLYANTHRTGFRCVVYDNASHDGSADAVAEAFPQVELIRATENIGFARANNIVAAAAETEWLLLLNPDTEVHDSAIDNLLDFAKAHPEAGITGGRTVFPDGSLNIASCWGRITPWSSFCFATSLRTAFPNSRLFNPEAYAGWKRDTVREVDIVVGCLLMIPRALWNELGGFQQKYFMYGEEADLCLRARAMGYRPMITPDAQIMHLVGAAADRREDKYVQVVRARATLIRDHWPAWQVPWGLAMLWLWSASRAALTRVVGSAKTRNHWGHIWKERRIWLKGYEEVPATSSSAGA